MATKGRPKINNLKPETISRYMRKARKGDLKAYKRLLEAGVSIKAPQAVGRPAKAFSELSKNTQQRYAKQIVKNVERLKTIDKSYEINQKYKKITSSAEVYGNLLYNVAGDIGANTFYEEFKKYKNKNAFEIRLKEIREEYKTKEKEDVYLLTDEEFQKFYQSKYYVLTESNEFDSEGLKQYYEEHNETVSETRFKSFLREVLIPEYQSKNDSVNLERINNILLNYQYKFSI